MKEEDKELLLKDLCARLPYGIIGLYSWKNREPYNRELTGNLYDELKSSWNSTEDSKFLPYLRPMESMKLEEYYELEELVRTENSNLNLDDTTARVTIDWFNKNMFDYRGLIPKGLAIKVTEENNPYESTSETY